MIVIVEEEVRKIGCAMRTGCISASISPFAGDGLDEAFGFAVGLRTVRFGKKVFDFEFTAGGGEVLGTIGGAAVGEDGLDFDVVKGVKLDGLMKSVENALDLFVWEKAGEGEPRMIIDGDVEAFDAGARVADGAIAGGADPWATEAAELFDVEVEELAWKGAFVAEDGRFGIQSGETMEAVAAQDTRDGGLGDADQAVLR